MTTAERNAYWEILCSLRGENYEADRAQLLAVIDYPPFLYRYRAVSVSSIDALQTNHLFFSRANYYDDPFDTFIKMDFQRINERIKEIVLSPNLDEQFNRFCAEMGVNHADQQNAGAVLQSANLDYLTSGIDAFLKKEVQPLLKASLWSVCFSESGINETMWLKYADQYKGFCLMYDLSDDAKRLCGKQDKCENCVVNTAGISLYPMCYSDEGYDATDYAANLAIALTANKLLNPTMAKTIIESLPPMTWQAERIALIKAKCHEYDREWRMLLNSNTNGPVMQEWIPYGVILGLRTSESDKDLIIRSAKAAGIQHIFETFITDFNKLDMREIAIR